MKFDPFAPGRALIDRLRFSTKFTLVGLLMLVPLSVLMYADWHSVDTDVAIAMHEREGLRLIVPALRFMQAEQQNRYYSRDPQAGTAANDARAQAAAQFDEWIAADARYGERFEASAALADIRNQWAALQTTATNASAHDRLIASVRAYLELVGDNSGLSTDPESSSYFMQDTLVQRLPAAMDWLHLLRLGAMQAVRSKRLLPEDAVRLNDWADHAETAGGNVQSALTKVVREQSGLQQRLGALLTQSRNRQVEFLEVVRKDILDARKLQVDPVAVAALGNDAVVAQSQLLDQLIPALEGVLVTRIDRLQNGLRRDLLVSAVAFLLAIYLLAALRSSLKHQVASMHDALGSMAAGKFRRSRITHAQDALGAFAERLEAQLEREQALSDHMLRVKKALDNAGTAFRIADRDGTVIYANPRMFDVLQSIEADVRLRNPDFSVDNFVGSNVGQLMENPEDYLRRLDDLKTLSMTEMKIGDRVFNVTTAPVFNDQGERLGSVGEWLDRTEQVAMEHELAEIVHAAAAGDFAKRVNLSGKHGFFLTLGRGLNQLMETGERGLDEVAVVLQALARGDLTHHLDGDYEGLFARLQSDANATVANLSDLVLQIRDMSGQVNIAAREIAAGNADLSSRTEEQASSLEETASSMEELSATVRQNAESARQANALAASSNALAAQGDATVQRVVATMGDIQEGSKRIADIVGVIDAIAFQTNILALNAAVEAARAGEQGRGFAVVASEVRGLAQRSATAAKEIRELILSASTRVEDGVRLVQEAGGTMNEVVNSFAGVARLMTDISAASREQAGGIDQVTRAVTQMDRVTQQNAALVEEAAAATESLENQARGLVELVSRFRLRGDEVRGRPIDGREASVLRDATPRRIQGRFRPPPRLGAQGVPAVDEDEWQEF